MTGILIIDRIVQLLNSIRDSIHPRAHEIVEGFVGVGETKIAVEHLCELLCEDDVILDASEYRELVEIIDVLGLVERFKDIVPVPNP